MQTRARLVAAALVSLSVLATSACGDSGDDKASDTSSASPSDDAPAAAGEECTVDDIEVEGEFGAKPTITVPDDCTAPTTLLSKDLVTGTGPEAKAGDTVETNYHLVTWSNKQVLDSSFDRGQTFPLENLGSAPVIDGWNQGLIGVQKGTRRLLVVPPDLGYGQGGNGVAPNETLVFVVDAVSIS
ncbi:FKBP-type peptidyl-prolyl cis-trans isomerase [Pimelobacter simplex]|uniref:Peptidyl-prolyl cis-trans isomerase n=1 Tax=Nocardioides simplex TaxID=2045 RepID=A0A0A1DPU6_NOCSI|nr:FKBP-type peptidyl-prolyl cis-trans isomerase [Pimelobacter simplex]AIY18543.1 peptidylprolyl isomerase, FKBP-type [Pimelobacter simplex]MCG8153288.1 FKBP-type peptidyl-prolyl cis-trans isomerase [Pimelobacter simplex]GEB14177.1 peptidyl-prolyl cis-trans isomerase [Pimelobacter simplex]SFM32759.1 FKBP-type peptidyl-prolyl cis-trans isomerase [Pimelobacter simplex]